MQQKKEVGNGQQPKQKIKRTSQLLKLLDKNQNIFLELKEQLMDQLNAYEGAFSRQHNKYIEDRDFDHFRECSQKFKRKGKGFIDRLAEIKNNSTQVIKNLPEQQKTLPSETNNSFDIFIDQHIDRTVDYKINSIRYESSFQKPFQKQTNPIFQ